MINFRFHLVSLIAVFLALAVGVVVGSTVVDRAIVDGLEAQIDRVEGNANEERRENRELRSELERQSLYSEELGAFAVQRRLTGVGVTVVAVRGVDSDHVRRSTDLVQEAGARVGAVLWLEEEWAGEEAGARDRGMRRLSVRLARGTAGPRGDVLARMEDGGLISIERVADDFDLAAFPGEGTRVVVVDGPGGRVPAEELSVVLARHLADRPLLTLVAEAGVDTPQEGEDPVEGGGIAARRDEALADRLSTVDGVDTLPGRVALVLALDELGRGGHGHYGIGPRASGLLPEVARG